MQDLLQVSNALLMVCLIAQLGVYFAVVTEEMTRLHESITAKEQEVHSYIYWVGNCYCDYIFCRSLSSIQ